MPLLLVERVVLPIFEQALVTSEPGVAQRTRGLVGDVTGER